MGNPFRRRAVKPVRSTMNDDDDQLVALDLQFGFTVAIPVDTFNPRVRQVIADALPEVAEAALDHLEALVQLRLLPDAIDPRE